MKTIQEVEAAMLAYVAAGNPEADWKPQTIEFFPGLSIEIDHAGDTNYPFAFDIYLTFSGISVNTIYHLGSGVSLCSEIQSLTVQFCEYIEDGAAKRVRNEIKSVLRI